MEPNLPSIKAYSRAMRFYVYMLYEFVLEMKCKKVLELGTQNGQSARAMLLALGQNKEGTLVSVDHKDRSTILDDSFQEYKQYWKFIQGNTTHIETIQAVMDTLGHWEDDGDITSDKPSPPSLCPNEFDLLLIDAGHDYESVKSDWDNYTPLVRSGGVVFLHDTVNFNEGVRHLWAEIDWPEKFNCDWGIGRASDKLIVGMGITKKP